jgi:hypothetical protein
MFSNKILLAIIPIFLTIANLNCFSEPEKISTAYNEKVKVEVNLGPVSGLDDITTDDILWTIRNQGDKIITELVAEITFSYANGNEAMRRQWYLIDVDKNMEKAVIEKKKVKWRPLPSGGVVEGGETVIGFFIGKPEMRKKARQDWDKLRAEIEVVSVKTEPAKN